ncbi:MAG TPA: potassium channel family protein [Solirubrobacteraceae bacterium]|jgi:hypothetical protein|nr:potassium channel family protein [Solirubrobacteraceae bacterium]
MDARGFIEIFLPPVVWLVPWVAFYTIVGNEHTHVTGDWIAAGLVVGGNLYVLFGVLLRRRVNALPRGLLFAGFALTLAALVGAYAYADLAASHDPAIMNCYVENPSHTGGLRSIDSIYFALSTLTTAGFGDIAAHAEPCRSLTAVELAIGLLTLGLSIAAVGARIFSEGGAGGGSSEAGALGGKVRPDARLGGGDAAGAERGSPGARRVAAAIAGMGMSDVPPPRIPSLPTSHPDLSLSPGGPVSEQASSEESPQGETPEG